ncbi:MAG: hypothetical protein K1Y02_06665 [Candidatus Hydrogenedentes bacterium]|nr:hypothetical protein [Candidatus Hydrogenedentota bacterium]
MHTPKNLLNATLRTGAALLLALATLGCPVDSGDSEYDIGFAAGFAQDGRYWDGYWDGWDMIDFTPIYYDTSDIPYVESPPYDAGYYDGIWYAYNDGYFVDYHYAFIVGFSEGYDNAYWSDYLAFLAFDEHTEFEHGGWVDGYFDGYSEGRVFGAADYEQGLPFDWLDALLDYESGTDLYFDEIDVGTGIYGPVILYEYGLDPNTLKAQAKAALRAKREPLTIRHNGEKVRKADPLGDYFRPFSQEAANELDVVPSESLRDSTQLRLTTSWLQRVNAYINATKSLEKRTIEPRDRRVDI